jgi:outer membrane lipoprotein carrier protein
MKKIFYTTLPLILSFFFFCPSAFCAQSEIDRCISKLEKKYEAMKDFHALFEQETHLSSIKRVEKGGGTVYFKKEGKMLWEYSKPTVQKIILDGKNLWFYLPEEKQVMKNNFSAIPQHIVVDLFRGKINIQEKFKVSFIQQVLKDKKAEIVIELIPIIYNPAIKKLTLWIEPEEYYISKSSFEDEFGNKTVLIFLKIEVDKGIDDSRFEFVPPPGVEIFEPPKM